jgi:hypothetical protein
MADQEMDPLYRLVQLEEARKRDAELITQLGEANRQLLAQLNAAPSNTPITGTTAADIATTIAFAMKKTKKPKVRNQTQTPDIHFPDERMAGG